MRKADYVYLNSFCAEMHSDILLFCPNGRTVEHTYSSIYKFFEEQGIETAKCVETVKKNGKIVVYIIQGYASPYLLALSVTALRHLLKHTKLYCINVSVDTDTDNLYMHEITPYGRCRWCISEWTHNIRAKARVLGLSIEPDMFEILQDNTIRLTKAQTIINGVYTIPPFVSAVASECFVGYKGDILKVINVQNNIKVMRGMFMSCYLSVLDLTQFSTQGVTDMTYMFGLSEIAEIRGIAHFDTSAVTSMSHLFNNARVVKPLNLVSWNTDNVKDLSYAFQYMRAPVIDISTWTTKNLQECRGMFNGCDASTILCGSMNMTEVISLCEMFSHSDVIELDLSSWKPIHCVNFGNMFYYCTKLKTLRLFCADLSDTTINTANMFNFCYSLTDIKCSEQTRLPKRIAFKECNSLDKSKLN